MKFTIKIDLGTFGESVASSLASIAESLRVIASQASGEEAAKLRGLAERLSGIAQPTTEKPS